MMAVIDNARVQKRHFVFPVDYIIQPRALSKTSNEYREHAIHLAKQVAEKCLAQAQLRPEAIDMIVTVSCTGVMIPSVDAYLINELGFRSDIKRLPITELGCAAGAAALGRVSEFLRAFPSAKALVIAVELPSLTFQRGNVSQANLISAALFGDGAAAALVVGEASKGPEILDAASHLFPHSIDAMGFDLHDTGFHIVLSKEVPQLIRDQIQRLVCVFLARHGLKTEQISAFLLHPGGQKLLSYVEEELGVSPESTRPSWRVLADYGNLSSASVLFILHEWLTQRSVPSGEYGLMAAFGPGFSAEMLLLRWV
jgi:alkylresorcinol/alkylpyrone synthase